MNPRTHKRREFVIHTTNLVYRFELELRKVNEDIAHLLDLESSLGLFLTTAIDKNAPFLYDRVAEFETDLMMYEVDRPEAEAIFRAFLRRTIAHIKATTGLSPHHFKHWRWLNREKRAVVLTERF